MLSSILRMVHYLGLLEVAEVLDVYKVVMDPSADQVVQHFEGYVLILLSYVCSVLSMCALSCGLFHSKEAFQSFLVFKFLRAATIGPLPGRRLSSTS